MCDTGEIPRRDHGSDQNITSPPQPLELLVELQLRSRQSGWCRLRVRRDRVGLLLRDPFEYIRGRGVCSDGVLLDLAHGKPGREHRQ